MSLRQSAIKFLQGFVRNKTKHKKQGLISNRSRVGLYAGKDIRRVVSDDEGCVTKDCTPATLSTSPELCFSIRFAIQYLGCIVDHRLQIRCDAALQGQLAG